MNLQRLKRSITLAKKPNKETRIAYRKAIEHGCCVCWREYNLFSPATIHHLTGGGMGLKSKDFIPL